MNTILKYQLLSSALIRFLHSKLSIYSFLFLLFCHSNIYSQNLSAENIYKKNSDAVVVVLSYNDKNELIKQGSGVIIKQKNYVITNHHVISGAQRFELVQNNRVIPYLDIIGIDVNRDIIILKIDASEFPSLNPSMFKSLRVGQKVYAIGSPMGLENSISEGIISGLRSNDEDEKKLIQITASISPGSSGGAVLNDRGEIIGISTLSIKQGQNLNFAISIDDVFDIKIASYLKNNEFKNFELFSQGLREFENGNYNESIYYFTTFISMYPDNKNAYYNRGCSKDEIGDYKGAIEDYSKSIEIDHDHWLAYINRSIAKVYLEDYKGALLDINEAIEINPDDPDAYNNRGLVYYCLKDYTEAIKEFNKAIKLNPKNSNFYLSRGSAKSCLLDYRGAISDYDEAIKFNPEDSKSYYNRGVIKILIHDTNGACIDFSKAGELGHEKAYDFIRELCN